MYVFENLRGEPLRHLYNVWDEIADVKAKGHETSIEFDYADGPPKTGIIVRSINDLKSIPYGKKAILIAERFPEDMLQYAHNIAAIIIEKNDEMASHIRFIMKPLGISIMAGAIHPIPVDLSGEITVHPLAKKLYLEPVNIIDMGQGMSRMNTYIKEMSAVARHLCERTSMHLPHFRTNISGQEHRDDTLFVGLTRTEQFLSPYVDATAFSKLREFLIGRGADLREIFAKAGDKYRHIPFVQNKRKSYESEFRLVAPLPTRVSQFEPEDVLRLLDIPAEEFFWAEDLKKFKNLYGNARGVKLARLVPDLYIMQLRNLERFGKFHQDGPPFILIPAVDCADDVHFVQHCAEKALPAHIFRMMYFGAMIDSKLACKNVGDIATSVSHISIGSNDLTADVLGISRQNPENAHQFTSLPKDLIPVLSELVKNAREANPRITISLCGEAAADIHSILALEEAGIFIDYFSVPSTYKDARLLPLIYADMKSEKFCGPLKEDEMTFRLPPRESEYAPR
ncbi:MAG TPA: hypothetical protein DCM27_05995 [Rhodospirillaceae bacterium]|nr:hypothetical protein [Rhodospirillaceae bacterium]